MSNEKMKVKLYVQAEKWTHDNDFKVEVYAHHQKTCDYKVVVDLSEVEIEVAIPSYDQKQLTLAEVDQLRAMVEKEKADSFVRVTAIEEKIQSLLCIENQVEK